MEKESTSGPYSPFTHHREIRIFQLDSGTQGDAITDKLDHVNLDEKPQHEALSYSWGNPKEGCLVAFEDGSPVRIASSLNKALKDLRHGAEMSCPRSI
jgi:hypothetical protein